MHVWNEVRSLLIKSQFVDEKKWWMHFKTEIKRKKQVKHTTAHNMCTAHAYQTPSYCIANHFTFDWNGDEDDYEFLEYEMYSYIVFFLFQFLVLFVLFAMLWILLVRRFICVRVCLSIFFYSHSVCSQVENFIQWPQSFYVRRCFLGPD